MFCCEADSKHVYIQRHAYNMIVPSLQCHTETQNSYPVISDSTSNSDWLSPDVKSRRWHAVCQMTLRFRMKFEVWVTIIQNIQMDSLILLEVSQKYKSVKWHITRPN